MNAHSQFSQSAIPNGHNVCVPTKKTVVCVSRAKRAVQYIGPCLKVWYCHRPALFDCRLHSLKCCFTSTETVGLLGTGSQDVHLDFHTAPELCLHSDIMDIYMPVYRSSPVWNDVLPRGTSLFRIISPVISGKRICCRVLQCNWPLLSHRLHFQLSFIHSCPLPPYPSYSSPSPVPLPYIPLVTWSPLDAHHASTCTIRSACTYCLTSSLNCEHSCWLLFSWAGIRLERSHSYLLLCHF